MNWRRYLRSWQSVCTGLALVAIIATGIYLQPGLRTPTTQVTGDEKVVAFLTPLLKGAHGNISAAIITPKGVRYGIWGEDGYVKQFELASVTKTMTASVLMEAIRRGEVTPHTRVGDIVAEIQGPARNITLQQLVSHRSGLPAQPFSLQQKAEMISAIIRRKNPWNYDQNALINIVNNAQLHAAGTFEYSNTGFALLGLALERASHKPFATLVKEKVFMPANMTNSVVALDNMPTETTFTPGWSASGFSESPWILHAFAPDGGVRSTIVDMVKYAQSLMAGNLAGSEGMIAEFATDDPDTRIGYSWFTTPIMGRDILWHDGQHSGYASVIAIDKQSKTAVVILSDTAWPVIGPAINLLLAETLSLKEE